MWMYGAELVAAGGITRASAARACMSMTGSWPAAMHEDLTPPDVRQQVTQVGDAGSTAWIVADGIGHMIHWQGRVWELPCNRSVDCFWKPHLQSVPLAQHAQTANDGTHKHTLEQSQHAHMWELLLQCSFTRSADCK